MYIYTKEYKINKNFTYQWLKKIKAASKNVVLYRKLYHNAPM